MSQPADIDSYVPAREAALRVRLNPDYISRLARQSRIRGKQVGRRWYVDQASLDAFLAAQSGAKESRREEIKNLRRKEYEELHEEKADDSAITAIEEAIAENVAPQAHHVVTKSVQHAGLISTPGLNAHALSYAIHPGVDFFNRVVALLTAFVLVFGAYGIVDREFGAAIVDTFAYTASATLAVGSVIAGASPDCDSGAERLIAAAYAAVGNILISLDNLMPSNLPDRALMTTTASCSK